MSAESKTHEIVILGGHFAGLGTAHYLLKHIIPQLSSLTPTTKYHLTIVYPHTEFFWSLAAPRHLISTSVIPPEEIWLPSEKGLKEYKDDQYTTVIGTAVAVNPETQVVSVQVEKGTQEIGYSSLVIATGTKSNSALWQINDHQDVSKSLFAELHASLPKAETVLIAGGGAVGVETAGEIATHYKKADITILSGSTRLLPRILPKNSAAAEAKLKKMGVTTVHNSKVDLSNKNSDGTTTVVFNDGTEKKVDVFIDATGGKPNTSFLPSEWLNEKGYVFVDDKTLRATASNVYAIGDVGTYSQGSFMDVGSGVPIVGTSIGIDIAAAAGKKEAFKPKEFKAMKGTQLVPIGPGGGVGQLFGWKVPSWLVWLIKSRTFFVEKAEPSLLGSDFAKA